MERVIIFGFGQGGKQAYDLLSTQKEIVAFCDSAPQEIVNYKGVPVVPPDQLVNFIYDKVIIASMHIDSIFAVLNSVGIDRTKVSVYETDRILIDKRLKDAEQLYTKHCRQPLASNPSTQELRDYTEHLFQRPPTDLTVDEWTCIYDYLVSKTEFKSALIARKRAQAQLHASPANDDHILGLLDFGEIELARLKLKQLTSPTESPPLLLSALFHMYAGQPTISQDILAHLFQPSHPTIAKIKNNTIAVVGPAASSCSTGEEIDKFDVVVRLSPAPINRIDHSKLGSRTDLIYVGAQAPTYMTQKALQLLKRPSILFVYESLLHPYQNEMLDQNRARTFEYNFRLFNGIPNFLQRVLADLIMIGASHIKLFNFDFYANTKRYRTGYSALFNRSKYCERPANYLVESQAVLHDFATQFNFCKMLIQHQLITADKHTTDVLALPLSKYFDRLQIAFK